LILATAHSTSRRLPLPCPAQQIAAPTLRRAASSTRKPRRSPAAGYRRSAQCEKRSPIAAAPSKNRTMSSPMTEAGSSPGRRKKPRRAPPAPESKSKASRHLTACTKPPTAADLAITGTIQPCRRVIVSTARFAAKPQAKFRSTTAISCFSASSAFSNSPRPRRPNQSRSFPSVHSLR